MLPFDGIAHLIFIAVYKYFGDRCKKDWVKPQTDVFSRRLKNVLTYGLQIKLLPGIEPGT